jgi:hypothetical protein
MADKRTIGLTAPNVSRIEDLVRKGHFNADLDAARFAMAFAVQRGEQAGNAEGTSTTWNIGSFDPTGEIRAVIEASFPNATEPYRLAEHLINRGLELLFPTSGPAIDVFETLFPNG